MRETRPLRDPGSIVLVLDLDDTLYKECDYVMSGLRYVEALLGGTGLDMQGQLVAHKSRAPSGDVWEFAVNSLRLPSSVKQQLLWAYRLHPPRIAMLPETKSWIERWVERAAAVTILTDGRSLTQRLKISALGLTHLPVYISEEWDGDKPARDRYLAITDRWPGRSYVAVGDNTAKDFTTPLALGWTACGLLDDGRNIHPQIIPHQVTARRTGQMHDGPSAPAHLIHWVKTLSEIDELLL
jgi:putative hydrolase of the HAD superfamily